MRQVQQDFLRETNLLTAFLLALHEFRVKVLVLAPFGVEKFCPIVAARNLSSPPPYQNLP